MSDYELEGLTGHLEDQVTDLRKLLADLPREAFGSAQNRRTLARLRGVAVDLTAIYLTASAISSEQGAELNVVR